MYVIPIGDGVNDMMSRAVLSQSAIRAKLKLHTRSIEGVETLQPKAIKKFMKSTWCGRRDSNPHSLSESRF